MQSQYDRDALRTESPVTPELLQRLVDSVRLLHAIAGKVTEAGELMDQFKRHVFYGKELDVTNLVEELGDDAWYGALLRDCITILRGTPVTQEEIQTLNINKLKARYPDKYTHLNALERDLDSERVVLERGREIGRELDRVVVGMSPVDTHLTPDEAYGEGWNDGVRQAMEVAKNIANWHDGQTHDHAIAEVARQEARLLGADIPSAPETRRSSSLVTGTGVSSPEGVCLKAGPIFSHEVSDQEALQQLYTAVRYINGGDELDAALRTAELALSRSLHENNDD